MASFLRVAWVSPERASSNSPNLVAFRDGLQELGYIQGKNLVIDTWWGEGQSEHLDQMAGDIVQFRLPGHKAFPGFAEPVS